MSVSDSGSILTLEPLIEAVRSAVERHGWILSGLQKTTSHQFEGRWDGDSTRSAYLFFHPKDDDPVSIDVYLDETSRGLAGNLALVVDLSRLSELPDTGTALRDLGALAAGSLPEGYPAPLTLRFRLEDGALDPGEADTEVRFKVRIPRSTIEAGATAVGDLCTTAVGAFERVRASPRLSPYLSNG